jgi:hypothetical protein
MFGAHKPKEVYYTNLGRFLGYLFGVVLGLYGLFNSILLLPFAVYYGSLGKRFIRTGFTGKPKFPLITKFGKFLGAIFGFYFGLKTLIDLIYIGFWKLTWFIT